MILKDLEGQNVEASVTVDHAASSYGVPVLVVGREALGPGDVIGWTVVEARPSERELLAKGRFSLPDAK